MKLFWKNGLYIAHVNHGTGYSEIRGFDRLEVLLTAIQNRYDYVNGI